MPRYIFRMTHYRNIEQQMIDGFLYSRNNLNGKARYSICYDEIVNRRGTEQFTPDLENLNEFVPFYFSPATAMSFTISQGNVIFKSPNGGSLGPGSNEHIVFYVCDPLQVHELGLKYWFTDIACNSGILPEFQNNIALLEEHISWDLFDDNPKMAHIREIGYNGVCSWFHDRDKPEKYQNRKKKRMAEFLVRDYFPIDLVKCIVTKSDRIRTEVEHWVDVNERNIDVLTKPGCFF